MSGTSVPKGYKSKLNMYMTQTAIGMLKRDFQDRLCEALNLKRVSAPLIVDPSTGLNDDLNGTERPVTFDIPAAGKNAAVVHSLAKWKRLALKRYGFSVGEGIVTDMNAIRRDETPDNLHSVYTDQWDWEKIMPQDSRNLDFLRDTAEKIVGAICDSAAMIRRVFPEITYEPRREMKFITSQELEDLYPALTPKQREDRITEEYGTVFVACIGGALRSGMPHDGRAPDYDDWSLNGDILFYNPLLQRSFEVSSMGIRVDPGTLKKQLGISGQTEREKLMFHRALLKGELPQTVGGGIGQSRLSMLLLEKAHIGEVQSSVWDPETERVCSENGIILL